MKTIFIGIDISKDTLDVAICLNPEEGFLSEFQVENTVAGIQKMIKKCNLYPNPLWFCFEHTGNYGYLLCHQLSSSAFTYSMVPALEIKRSQGLSRGKTDKLDAQRIALYAITHQHKLNAYELKSEVLLKIKNLLTYRSQQVNILRQYKNSLKSHRTTDIVIDNSYIIDDIRSTVEELIAKIKLIEKKIIRLIDQDDSLYKSFNKVRSVTGIGLIIAAYMLVSTNNFSSFDNPRKYTCYAGIAPFEYSSGSSIKGKTKTNKLRNKTIKTLLFNGANTAVRTDPELKAYYKRKADQGKPHQVIINNIACKLVYRMFAVVKRDELYVKLVR